MRLESVYTRFFRSLNFDYILLSNPGYTPRPWDDVPGGDSYPFVHLRLEADITTVVGGNESGKSQILAAVKAALSGEGYERSDFCRYSPFFSVNKTLTKPEFGVGFTDLSEADLDTLAQACNLKSAPQADAVVFFRMNATPQQRLYFRVDGVWGEPVVVRRPTLVKDAGLPSFFEIDAKTPLPDSVPLSYLANASASDTMSREFLRDVWQTLRKNRAWFATAESVGQQAGQISNALGQRRAVTEKDLEKFKLAADLLLTVAGLERSLFQELQDAVRKKDGYASSVVDTINSELAKGLNFPHWWSQDSQFELFVSLFEFDLVFMIRDRTGRSYAFDERSDGLKYFLSYFVQYLAHKAPDDGSKEVLLMDEPDRFLSSSGQQDLLRVFADFADPHDDDRPAVQVLYVTHSPFLIDKNHAERIRVLEKGEFDEGTRVVAKVAQNHYEPLRSAFGSFVGETAFIGTCNLMLEGASDQVLLAGLSSRLGRRGAPLLDRLNLNEITLVPAGGVSEVPYLIYLARGRDVDQPPVIALLDGDAAADEARRTIKKGGARRKPLIPDVLVLQLSDDDLADVVVDNPHGRVAIEDLIPVDLAVAAASRYCKEFVPDIDLEACGVVGEIVFSSDHRAEGGGAPGAKGLVDDLEKVVRHQSGVGGFELNKLGFARSVLAEADRRADSDPDVERLDANFRALFRALGVRQRAAVRAETSDRISSRIKRARERFLREHVSSATRENVTLLIEEISGVLDDSQEAEDVRHQMQSWRLRYKLNEDPREQIDSIEDLRQQLASLAYQGERNAAEEPLASRPA